MELFGPIFVPGYSSKRMEQKSCIEGKFGGEVPVKRRP